MPSKKNKTITLTPEEKDSYLSLAKDIDFLKKENDVVDTVMNADAFVALQHIKKETVDLVIFDPPYNLAKDFGTEKFTKMDTTSYMDYIEKWLLSIKPLMKKSASIYVCCDWQSSVAVGFMMEKHFSLLNRITWGREKGRGAKRNWKNSMEDIYFAVNDKNDYTFNLDDVKVKRKVIAPYKENGKPKDWSKEKEGNFRLTHPGNFWDDISIPFWSMAENTPHPTQKSEKLIAKLILASSNPGDIVLDPCCGSGTTGVVAKKLDRHYILIEKDTTYLAITQKRLEMAETNKRIQGYQNKIFFERNSEPPSNKEEK